MTFRAKADAARTLPVAASLDQDDWHNIGLAANAALTTDWKPFSYVFTAPDTVPNHARLAFTLGAHTGIVSIADLQIHPGASEVGLPPGQSLLTKTVDIPLSPLKAQNDDWMAFLADTELGYADDMRRYLKETLHVRANLICSQISWGGLTGLSREARSDFADNHAYWQHPSFPNKQWDPKDWNIPNTPMVADLAAGKGGTLRDLAEYRVAGKPYSVSEYNHPAPSDFRAETLPELATFAAFQDWDALYLFDYGPYGTGASNDKINGYFGIGSDPAKTAFLPAAAMIFRASEVPSGVTLERVELMKPVGTVPLTAAALWKAAGPDNPPFLAHRLAVSLDTQPNPTSLILAVKEPLSGPAFSGTHLVVKAENLYSAAGQRAQSVAGYVGGRTVTLGDNTLTFPAFGNNFAAVTLTAMDQKPTAQSARLLLTLAGKVENRNMGWNANRTSVGDQWGPGPTQAEGIPATVTLQTNGPRSVWALDGTGRHMEKVPAVYAHGTVTHGTVTFTGGPQYRTLWYAVEK